jgi:hypothetical protein
LEVSVFFPADNGVDKDTVRERKSDLL